MQAHRPPRNELKTVVVPGRSITFEARDFAHWVWDGAWDAWLWDEEKGDAAAWFSALPQEAVRGIGRLERVDRLFAGDYVVRLGGRRAWLDAIEFVPRVRRVVEDFTFTLRLGDQAQSARTFDLGPIVAVTERTVTLWVAEWPSLAPRRRRYPVDGDFAHFNAQNDPALMQLGHYQ